MEHPYYKHLHNLLPPTINLLKTPLDHRTLHLTVQLHKILCRTHHIHMVSPNPHLHHKIPHLTTHLHKTLYLHMGSLRPHLKKDDSVSSSAGSALAAGGQHGQYLRAVRLVHHADKLPKRELFMYAATAALLTMFVEQGHDSIEHI